MVSESGKANFSGADAYERYMGRWSRLASVEFLDWLAVSAGSRWLDVGSGTGALSGAILQRCAPATVQGIERAEALVDCARDAIQDERVTFDIGDAESLPAKNADYDAVVSGLVLNFIPDVDRGIAEMVRAARPGGTVAAYVWDYGGKMEIMRKFWDVAVELDPQASKFDEGKREPALCTPEALTAHFELAGLVDIEVVAIDVRAHFVDFDDYWSPFTGGQGSAPTYTAGLDEESRETLRSRLHSALPITGDGSIDLIARAWAVRGRRPG